MVLKTGWQGRFYEDFEVGDIYRHPLGRTVMVYTREGSPRFREDVAGRDVAGDGR